MKKLLLLFGILLSTFTIKAQTCLTVTEVFNQTENPELSSKKYTFGVKQLTEEILSEKYSICMDGKPVIVYIQSIEAPTTGISIGPFMIKKKVTIVKTAISIDGNVVEGEGTAKLSVQATFIELRDENLPFERTTFSVAIKKSLENAISNL